MVAILIETKSVDRGLSRVDHWLRPEPAKMADFITGPDIGRRDSCVIGVVSANISAATGMGWLTSS